MSYILDSLGKAEQTRLDQHSPELRQVFDGGLAPVRASKISPIFHLSGIFIAFFAGVLIGPSLVATLNKYTSPELLPNNSVIVDPIKGYAKRIKQDQINLVPPLKSDTTSILKIPRIKPVIKANEPVLVSLNPVTDVSISNPIQAVNISVISYSDLASQRFAMINGSIVKQGDILAQGYVIKKINPDTVEVVLNNKQLTLRLN